MEWKFLPEIPEDLQDAVKNNFVAVNGGGNLSMRGFYNHKTLADGWYDRQLGKVILDNGIWYELILVMTPGIMKDVHHMPKWSLFVQMHYPLCECGYELGKNWPDCQKCSESFDSPTMRVH